MKALFKTIIITALTATLLAAPGSTFAQDKKDEKGKDKAGEKGKKEGVLPFNGKAAAVDKAAK